MRENVGSGNVNEDNMDVVAGAGHHGSGPETEVLLRYLFPINLYLNKGMAMIVRMR